MSFLSTIAKTVCSGISTVTDCTIGAVGRKVVTTTKDVITVCGTKLGNNIAWANYKLGYGARPQDGCVGDQSGYGVNGSVSVGFELDTIDGLEDSKKEPKKEPETDINFDEKYWDELIGTTENTKKSYGCGMAMGAFIVNKIAVPLAKAVGKVGLNVSIMLAKFSWKFVKIATTQIGVPVLKIVYTEIVVPVIKYSVLAGFVALAFNHIGISIVIGKFLATYGFKLLWFLLTL
jgi:hypothetical protein